MSDTFCGNSCESCEQRTYLGCPGCKAGPGMPWGGNCGVAKCTRGKGHRSCEDCGLVDNCHTFRARLTMPQYWRKRKDSEDARKADIARRAVGMGKWLWTLFWLTILWNIISYLSNDSVVDATSTLFYLGVILNLVLSVATGIVMLKLSSEEELYRTAGIFTLLSAFGNFAMNLSGSNQILYLLIAIPAVVLTFMAEHKQYKAHAEALVEVDRELSEKWDRLWRWFLGSYGAVVVSLFLAVIPLIGILILFVSATAILVVNILKLVYLYKTAKAFRDYSPH